MSLFSRLEERMRARDSQDDSKKNENSTGSEENSEGLFGSVQLRPAEGEPSVPPPPANQGIRPVPSLEEARAELERVRAQKAPEGQPASSLFRRDNAPEDDADDAPHAAPPAARESVTFSSVTLPPLGTEEAATPTAFAPDAPAPESESQPTSTQVFADANENGVPMDKPFRVPSLSQFAANENAATPGADEAQISPAPRENDENSEEQVAYAPTSPEGVARTEEQTVAAHDNDNVPAIETLQFAEAQRDETASVETTLETPTVPESPVPGFTSAHAEERAATRLSNLSNPSNLTPFQRLMAARAAQGGAPMSRPRAERPASVTPSQPRPVAEAPIVESPIVESPIVESPVVEVPVMELPPVELPREAVSQAEFPEAEEVEVAAEQTPVAEMREESPRVEAPVEASIEEIEQSPEVADEVAAPQSDIELPTAGLPQGSAPQIEIPDEELLAAPEPQLQAPEESPMPAVETAVATEEAFASVALPESSVAAATSTEAPLLAKADALLLNDAASEVEVPEAQAFSTETMASRLDDSIAQSATLMAPEAQNEEAQDELEENGAEAEMVPGADSSSSAPEDRELPREVPVAPTSEQEAKPALSLAERLARAPRAELEAARAEAESLTPEILEESTPVTPSRPPSFAERLAARNRPDASATPTSIAPAVPVAPVPPAIQTPSEPPRTAAPRTFSERLAARTGLDRHLQVPAEESAPASQDLATHNTELARINEGAELSEREMKNRVLFRQKHLMFDAVIGAIDARTLQNPTREAVKPQIEKGVDAALREFDLALEPFERNWLVDEFVREITDLGALVPMLEDPSVSKIVVTGANDVSVERLGRIERTGVSFRDDDHLLSLVRRIAEMSGGRVDAKVPLLDRPLPDGGRIRAKVPPLAPQPTLTIEKSTGNPFVVLKRQMQQKSRGDALPYAQLRERIQQRLLREFEGDAAALGGDQDKLRVQVEEMIGSVIAEEQVAVTRAERASLVMDLLNEIVGLGPIEPLLNDPDVDEVMVNGPYQIYIERKGKLELTTQRFRDNAHVMQVIDRIVAPLGRRVDEKSPMVDGRLRDGSRFNAIIPPLALSGPTMTIRKFARDPFTMSDLINFGTLTREAAQFLQASVEGRLNVVVSGGTGSGKTTTLNVLSSFIPASERIVTIEDAAELQMRQEHVIRMETRPPNIEGIGEVGIRDLVKNSLRMRPDRIVVGECRGGEALDMLQAMNTGHDGSLTTAHSNGPRDTCKRLETMVMMAGFDLPVRAIREQISMAVQLVVHQERMRDGKRRVTAITEIVGMEGDVLTLQDIFRFEQEGIDDDGRIIGSLQATGMRPKHYETIIDNGGQLAMDIFTPKTHEAAPRSRMTERGAR